MPVDLQTIPDVELVSTGTYALASGPATFTEEDLAAAVAAAADPTVPAPRIKIGHTDPRFAAELDGEPAFGVVANMRLSEDRQTILGDLVNVPSWLAEALPSSYPSRSIEGGMGFDAPSGRRYELVISALALLGVQWPGVTSLADLTEILEQNGDVHEAEALVAASNATAFDGLRAAPDVAAGIDVDLVRRRLVEDLDTGEFVVPEGADPGYTWWPRSVRFEDDGTPVLICEDGAGNLFRIAFTVDGDEVQFAPAERVVEQYVPVAAAASRTTSVLASWHTRGDARPTTTDQEALEPMTEDQRRAFALALGQPEDTPEDRLHELAAERAAADPEPDPAPEPVVEAPPAALPEGTIAVDAETWEQTRQGAEEGLAVAARLRRQDRDAAITAAISQGRIPVARRAHYETAWDRDPDGTRTLLTADVEAGGLAPGLVPVAAGGAEIGRVGDGDGDQSNADAEHDAYMRRYHPQVHARLHESSTGLRVRQEA